MNHRIRGSFLAGACGIGLSSCSVFLPSHGRAAFDEGVETTRAEIGTASAEDAFDAEERRQIVAALRFGQRLRDQQAAALQRARRDEAAWERARRDKEKAIREVVEALTTMLRSSISQADVVMDETEQLIGALPDVFAPMPKQPPANFEELALDPVTGAAAAAAVGFAVDYVADEVESHAEGYEAQYETSTQKGVAPLELTQDGLLGQVPQSIEVTRRITGFRDGDEDACRITIELDLHPITRSDSHLVAFAIRGRPTYELAAAKTDVFTDNGWWWLSPTYGIGRLLKSAGHLAEIEVDVVIESLSLTDKGQPVSNEITLNFAPQSIDLNDGDDGQAGAVTGMWTPAKGILLPGAFLNARVLVTERDPSNAQKRLKQAANAIRGQKADLVGLVE